ncbi:MAG: hypothetical protein ACJ74O_19690 [Frankiaceae bacterium]
MAVVAAEPATTALVLGCSLARGAGDRWSDVDARHLFAQYADGLQLSLVVRPAGEWQGRAPGEVVLHDPAGAFATDRVPAVLRADADDVREWAFLGWIALADLVKYLARCSPPATGSRTCWPTPRRRGRGALHPRPAAGTVPVWQLRRSSSWTSTGSP